MATGNSIPDYAPDEYADPVAWLNAIEKIEKGEKARVANKIIVALPRELSLAEQKELIQNFVEENFAKNGYCAAWAIHTDEENNNPHAHILVADRKIEKNGNWQKVKQKKVIARDVDGNKIPILDENGNQKVRKRQGKGEEKLWERITVDSNPLSNRDGVEAIRADWANMCNARLSQESKIDHRSFERQGKQQLAQIHVGYAGWQMKARSGRWIENERRKSLNAQIANLSRKIEASRAANSRTASPPPPKEQSKPRDTAYVCASLRDAVQVAGGEENLIQAILRSPGWKSTCHGKTLQKKNSAERQLRKAVYDGVKNGTKATVIVASQSSKLAASVIKVTASVLKNTLGAIPILGAPIKLASSAAEGAADGMKNGLGRVQDALIKKDAQNERQERQRQDQREEEPNEKEDEAKAGGSASQMRDTDALDELLKYTDYKWLSVFDREAQQRKKLMREV